MFKFIALAPLSLVATAALAADARPEPLVFRIEVNAPRAEVWRALTTPEGVRTFFWSDALVEPKIGGAYEVYFTPNGPPGLRGGEGIRILAMEEPSRFFISWNAPTNFGAYRDQKTTVEFELEPLSENKTQVTLTHGGWGRADAWKPVHNYFASAWKNVLGRLQYRFDHGPIDWSKRPDGAAYFTAAK